MGKPNIIFYFTDQQRHDTLGCYGQKLDISPNLDALAKEGILFEEAYTAQPVCGPCRHFSDRTVSHSKSTVFAMRSLFPACETLADYLNEAGYETAYVGKWHLASERKDYSTPPIVDYETKAIPREKGRLSWILEGSRPPGIYLPRVWRVCL